MEEKVTWSDSYLLNIEEIDTQHKKLVAIANELYDVINGNDAQYETKMKEILKKLSDYTQYHFTNEEEFMSKYGYTGTSIHKVAHNNFIAEVKYQMDRLEKSDKSGANRFYTFVTGWILNHIAKADVVWADFVKKNM